MTTDNLGSRARTIPRKKWFLPAFIVVVVAVAFLQSFLFSGDAEEVTSRLEAKYGVEEVVWQSHGRYQRDTLVVDGRDISDQCAVTGDWGPLDDVAIECEGGTEFEPADH